MEQAQTTSPSNPDAEFKKRRDQKNRIVVSLVLGGVALIWAVTMLKFNASAFRNTVVVEKSEGGAAADADTARHPQKLLEGGQNAQ